MVYADTSALMKRYLTEANSERFEAFFLARLPIVISRLTVVEMRSALARRRREGQIGPDLERAAMEEVRRDIQDGAIRLEPVDDGQIAEAYHLIDGMPAIPLRTLDALHLAVARGLSASGFATADRTQAEAARALGFDVSTFY